MGEAVTGGAFALLGVEPLLGRAIQPDDDIARGGHPVVMLSHGYWQRAFGADPHVVSRTLRMGGRNYTIIGVAPPNYRGGAGPENALPSSSTARHRYSRSPAMRTTISSKCGRLFGRERR